jgi:hypothetical protein
MSKLLRVIKLSAISARELSAVSVQLSARIGPANTSRAVVQIATPAPALADR